ncbi:serine hydrolase [Catellatospora sichuanensis]|uniref:serine hydrolase n=1 Tax=Catellatospora sichuanensis TaxID=1969805 RepID=UPI001183E492|nr:serine hydrolase [Catellatospora sichuanensis]
MRRRTPLTAATTALGVLVLALVAPTATTALTGSQNVQVSAEAADARPAPAATPAPGATPTTAATPAPTASAADPTAAAKQRASSRVADRPSRSLTAGRVNLAFTGDFIGYAMLDRKTGEIIASRNAAQTSSTESMIKVWLVADRLRRAAESGQTVTPPELAQASAAIRHSDDRAAQALYRAGGGNEVVQRMIDICGLTDTTLFDQWWSRTQMSPRDAVRLARCIADGTAAGPSWTGWVLSEMRQVTGSTAPEEQFATTGGGRWGIIDGVPDTLARTLAIKNGWTAIGADGNWHLNCLAISDDWIMNVMTRYPVENGLQYGADVCADVARQLVTPPAT